MFRKLKLQFILTNLAIIGILFFLITCGAYFLVQAQMISHVKDFSRRMAEAINSGMMPDPPKPVNPAFHPGPPPAVNKPAPACGPFSIFPKANPAPLPNPNGPPPQINPNPRPPFAKDRPCPPPAPRQIGLIPNFPKYDQLPPQVFYVKLNPLGKIISQSGGQPFLPSQRSELARQTIGIQDARGTINFQHFHYYYYKTTLKKQAGTLIIFLGLEPEERGLRSLMTSLMLIGGLSLIFGLCGSLFMAGRAIRPIQEAWRQQKEFIADASHELRTPLTVIQTNLEVVLSNPAESVASQMDWLVNIKDETDQMAELIASLLFLARMDSHQWVMERKPFDLNQVASRVFEAYKPVASAHGIHLTIEPFVGLTVLGDESGIRQVMGIFLDNALRHTPAGGQIGLQLRREDKKVFLIIADTGEGIPTAHLEKIFDRFYQVDASRSKGKAGLGLAIAKGIIESHNGTIHVASTVGTGTTFTIQLPAPEQPDNKPDVPGNLTKDIS